MFNSIDMYIINLAKTFIQNHFPILLDKEYSTITLFCSLLFVLNFYLSKDTNKK